MKATAFKKVMAALLMAALFICAMPMAVSAETGLAFERAALTLEDNLSIQFKASETLFANDGYSAPYAVFEFNGAETTVSEYTVAGGFYVFKFSDIAPNKMNDSVKATLYATYNGAEVASDPITYSVKEYCYDMLSQEIDAKLRTLLVDLLNYGAQSQLYSGYEMDALVNADLTQEQAAWGTAGDPVLKNLFNKEFATIASPTATWKGAGLILNDAVTLRLKFSAPKIYAVQMKIKNETSGQEWTINNIKFAPAGAADTYYCYFSELNAAQMGNELHLTLCDLKGNAISNTVRYSIESYAAQKQGVAGLSDLVNAMMKYGNAAAAYVAE